MKHRAGLYIHLPFCRSKCGYCAFNSQVAPTSLRLAYLACLHKEMERMARHPWCRAQLFDTLFIGGGTPTIYSGQELQQLVGQCRALFSLRTDLEISLESNPNTLDREKLDLLRACGVNRLSIGVQSFDDRLLTGMERSHTAQEAENAVGMARAAGFVNINLDLIFGLPGQTMPQWQQTLETALELGPEHLAVYELMVEEDSAFGRRAVRGDGLRLPSEEATVGMTQITKELLGKTRLRRYEISNYARPGRECRHNLHYWHNESYLGLGAGAVSCFNGLRIRTLEQPREYITAIDNHNFPFLDGEGLSSEAAFRETVIMGLRLTGGFALEEVENRYNRTTREVYGNTVDTLCQRGLLTRQDGMLRLTPTALPVANQVLAELV